MVLRVDVVDAALRGRLRRRTGRGAGRSCSRRRAGRSTTRSPTELAAEPHLALLCGRYEGVDERVREHLADDAVSIGPYVLSGGELAAMVVADAVLRKLPGALGHADERARGVVLRGARRRRPSTRTTRGRPSYRGWEVPEVLLSGDHERVREWRLERSRERAGAERLRRA